MGIKYHSLYYHLDFPLTFFLPLYSGKILEINFNKFCIILILAMLVVFHQSKAKDVLRTYLLHQNSFVLDFKNIFRTNIIRNGYSLSPNVVLYNPS